MEGETTKTLHGLMNMCEHMHVCLCSARSECEVDTILFRVELSSSVQVSVG